MKGDPNPGRGSAWMDWSLEMRKEKREVHSFIDQTKSG